MEEHTPSPSFFTMSTSMNTMDDLMCGYNNTCSNNMMCGDNNTC